MQNNYLWLGVGILAAVVVGAGLFFFGPRAAVAPTQSNTATSTNASSTTITIGNATITAPAGTVIKEVPNGPQAPSLSVVVSYSSDLPADAVATLKLDIASTTAFLKNNPTNGDEWLQLAVYYKIAGDYQAAENVWLYMTQAAPSNYVAFGDLGDLYMNFLTNYQKAVTYYKKALALNPKDIDYYNSLYIIYRYDLGDMASAKAIVSQGLAANPGDPTLTSLQNQLQSGQ